MNKYISIICIVVVLAVLAFIVVTSYKHKNVDTYSNTVAENTDTQAQVENTEEVNTETNTTINNNDNKKTMYATINTNMGSIKIEFFDEAAPKTVGNFVKLAESNFYNNVKFHRVIKGFMIQGGDPLTKDDSKAALWGTGGPGYKFEDEIDTKSELYTKVGYKKGIVAMANSGQNTNGSQFFIMNEDYALPPLYTIFGKVVAGQDVVDKIALVKTGPGDRPIDPVVIQSIKIQ